MKENKMKPKRTQRHARPQWEGKGVTTADKTSLSQAKPTSRVSSPAHVKPFAGKVFYLDLPSNRTAEMLESDIKELGGTVEKFFSKEIKYLVSNKKEARYVHCLRQDSPVPSPVSTQSSPHPRSNPHHPGSHGDNIKSRSQGQTDTFVTSRGKSLVERVVKEQERVQMNKILSNALEWGVKILYLHDVLAYVHKKKKLFSSHCPATTAVKTSVKGEQATKQSLQKCKGGRFSKPFIKVEDSSRHYRPIYLTMPNMPEFNLKTIPPCSPFCANDKDPPRNKQWEHRDEKASASEERAHGRKKNRDKKRGGYCECCMIKYENLTMHLQSERHKAFSRGDEYLVVDRLGSTLHCNFIHIKTKVRRPKCSVSSVLVAPGPCEKPELRDMRDFNKKQDQQWAVDKDDGSFSEHPLKVTSVPGSAHPIHTVGDRKNCYPYSYTSKHKSLARKRPCRQNSSTSCTQKAEQGQSPQLKTETAPSTGECLGSFPSTVTQADPVDPVSHKEMNSSASLFHNMDLQNEVSSKKLHVTTNHQEDFLLFEAIPDGNIFLEKSTGNNLTEREEGSLHTQSLSPVRKIQRKIRVYKRKRQKVDTHLKHLKPNNVPDHSILKLWELFQSSDDMDVEFHGFED